MMWQNFLYLNWPATRRQRGLPNKNAKFGAPAPTVWETYKTADESFPPGGRNPGPWDGLRLLTTLETGLAQRVASGAVRHLTMRSKISRAVLNNVADHAGVIPTDILRSITQAGGGTLYDLNGKPVYYEVRDKPRRVRVHRAERPLQRRHAGDLRRNERDHAA